MRTSRNMDLQLEDQVDDSRALLHMDLDSFFVSVERLINPALIGVPVIVGGSSRRGVVAAASYEARAFGVHSAMSSVLAKRLCPHAIVVKGDMEAYSQHSAIITEMIAEKAPLFEKSSIDEFYLDLTGMDHYFGLEKWSSELRQSIMKETRLPISMGLSVNKPVAKMATNDAKPNGQKHVKAPEVRPFIHPMPIEKMPMLGEVTSRFLRGMGIDTIGRLASFPHEAIEIALGKNGLMLWQRARGHDTTPVVPFREAKSISTEHTFAEDTTDMPHLRSSLLGMVEKVSFQMRQKQRMCSVVTVKIRYADFQTYTRQAHIPYTSREDLLYETVLDLFQRLYSRRLLIRLIGIRFSGLVNANNQMRLFDDSLRQIDLMQATDRIKNRFGVGAISRASGLFALKGSRISEVGLGEG